MTENKATPNAETVEVTDDNKAKIDSNMDSNDNNDTKMDDIINGNDDDNEINNINDDDDDEYTLSQNMNRNSIATFVNCLEPFLSCITNEYETNSVEETVMKPVINMLYKCCEQQVRI